MLSRCPMSGRRDQAGIACRVFQGVNDAELQIQAGGCKPGWAVEVSSPLAPAGVTEAGEAGAVGSVRCAEQLAWHPKTKVPSLP